MIASMAESGGAEMLVRNLALAYARAGHRCHLVYISDAASLGASEAYERAFREQLDAAGITHARLGHRCRRNPVLGGWRLRREVRLFRPDVAHIHLGYGLLFQVLGLVRVPTVYTNHNIIFRFSPRLIPLFDQFVDRYVAICGACRVMLERYVGRPVTTIFNGVPADFSDAAPRTAVACDPQVLSVGNLFPQKDYPTLIAVAERLVPQFRAQGRTITFRIAGEGVERPALQRLIRERGLEERVLLLGTRQDVAALMAGADLLLQASRWEGLPIALIEAAMSALPAVATDVGGTADAVMDGVTGTLVAPGDPDRIAMAVAALLNDPARHHAYSIAARDHGRRFTLHSCAQAHLALYAEVAGRVKGIA